MKDKTPATNNKNSPSQLSFPLLLTGSILIVELIGGWLFGSLSLMSDAVHMATDVLSLLMTWFTLKISSRMPSVKRTFGYHRTEVFSAFLNGILLLGVSIFILREAYQRFHMWNEIATSEVLIIAILGLLANVFVLLRVHGSKDLNIRSAYWHVLSDTLTSIGVIVGTIVVMVTGYTFIDPLLSAVIAFLILYNALKIILNAASILLDFSPRDIVLDDVIKVIESVPHVRTVHRVFFRSLCPNVNTLEAHIVTDLTNLDDLHSIDCKLQSKLLQFNIKHTTFQFEHSEQMTCDLEDMLEQIGH